MVRELERLRERNRELEHANRRLERAVAAARADCIMAILAFAFVSFGSFVPVDAQIDYERLGFTPNGIPTVEVVSPRWVGREAVDDFSGETIYYAMYITGNVSIGFSCVDNDTYVIVTLDDGISRDGTFQYRVDDSDVRDAEWTDDNENIYTQGDRSITFLRDISGGRELRVRIPRFRSRYRVDQTFPLDGMAPHLSEVRRRCDW